MLFYSLKYNRTNRIEYLFDRITLSNFFSSLFDYNVRDVGGQTYVWHYLFFTLNHIEMARNFITETNQREKDELHDIMMTHRCTLARNIHFSYLNIWYQSKTFHSFFFCCCLMINIQI